MQCTGSCPSRLAPIEVLKSYALLKKSIQHLRTALASRAETKFSRCCSRQLLDCEFQRSESSSELAAAHQNPRSFLEEVPDLHSLLGRFSYGQGGGEAWFRTNHRTLILIQVNQL